MLSDPEARRKYDQFGEEGLKPGPAGGGFQFRDAGRMFEQFFGGGGGFGGGSFTFTMGGGGNVLSLQRDSVFKCDPRARFNNNARSPKSIHNYNKLGGRQFGFGQRGGGGHHQQRQRRPQQPQHEELYKADDGDIEILTAANFYDKVINDEDVWLVQFYSPGCTYIYMF